jgi:hypothetical protein
MPWESSHSNDFLKIYKPKGFETGEVANAAAISIQKWYRGYQVRRFMSPAVRFLSLLG